MTKKIVKKSSLAWILNKIAIFYFFGPFSGHNKGNGLLLTDLEKKKNYFYGNFTKWGGGVIAL